MRFQVPQFIGVEDRIFGPFTAKQFLFLAGGGGVCYLLYKFLPFIIALVFIIPVAALSLALTFVKINGKPFIFTLEAGIKYLLANKLYLWKKAPPEKNEDDSLGNLGTTKTLGAGDFAPAIEGSRLKNMTWSLDTSQNHEVAENSRR